MNCEMQMDLEKLRLHLQVIYPVEGVTCNSICSSAGENNSQYNHRITPCYNPSKQPSKPHQTRTCNENALTSPVHARAGRDADRTPLSYNTVPWWGKACCQGEL